MFRIKCSTVESEGGAERLTVALISTQKVLAKEETIQKAVLKGTEYLPHRLRKVLAKEGLIQKVVLKGTQFLPHRLLKVLTKEEMIPKVVLKGTQSLQHQQQNALPNGILTLPIIPNHSRRLA